MRVLVAGATGVIGRQLLPRLAARGHDVVGLARTPARERLITDLGAAAVVADALDREGIRRAVEEAAPEVIVHQLTALAGALDIRHMDRSFARTNRLRMEGTDNLLEAGRAVEVRRFVAQSFAGWPYARRGPSVKTEDDELDPSPAEPMRGILDAIRHLETAVTGAEWTEGVVLRYGALYGPGTSLDRDGDQTRLIRRRRLPVLGDGGGVWSFVHVEDAAEATVAAVEHASRGIYNIVDDEPARVAEWIPAMAAAIGAKPPRRVPRRLGRLLAGEAATVLMTEVRGASNAKARRELGWRPAHPSWRGSIGREAA